MGYMKGIPHTSSIKVELQALWQDLRISIDQMLTPLVIDTDSTEIINMIRNGNLTHNPTIYDCRSIMEQLGNPAIGHNYREQNQVADLLAKEGAKKGRFERTQFLAVPSIFANEAAWAYILGTVFKRKINICNIDTFSVNATTQENSHSLTNDVIL